MLLLEAQLESQFGDQLILEVIAMVSDNLSWDTKSWNNLVEEKQGFCLTIVFEGRHGLSPLRNVVDF